jgi:predicted dehydrogenase
LPRYTPIGGPFSGETPPPELDWDKWQGPAPAHDYSPYRCRFFGYWYEYGGGIMTGWGSHHLDIVHWALDVEDKGPLSVAGAMPSLERRRIEAADSFNTPADFRVDFIYPGNVRVQVVLGDEGILFEGDRGRIYVNRKRLTGKPVEELAENPLPSSAVRLYESFDHLNNFVDCVHSRRTPISDVASQHRSATACHLANISLRLGRKLAWDADREEFPGDDEANRLLGRVSRAPYDFVA